MKLKIGARCMASNWAGVFFLYSLPLNLLVGELLLVIAAFHQNALSHAPNGLSNLMGAVFCGGPICMVVGGLLFAVLGYFIGLFYGVHAVLKD